MTIEALIKYLQTLDPKMRVFTMSRPRHIGHPHFLSLAETHQLGVPEMSIFSEKRRPDFLKYAKEKMLFSMWKDIDEFLLL